MGLDSKFTGNEVYFQKSDFDYISVVARSQPKKRLHRSMQLPVGMNKREKVPRKNPSDGDRAASRSSISKKRDYQIKSKFPVGAGMSTL